MSSIVMHNARVLTLDGPRGPRRGEELRNLGVIECGYVVINNGIIDSVGTGEAPHTSKATRIDACGRVLMPGFVDCHTHACWAGDRFDEFERKLAGASYLDILRAGGGIMSTVRATRLASEEQLVEALKLRLDRMNALGTTSVEIKSGYGLSTDAELKMLRAILAASAQSPLNIVPTFLGAHAIDQDNPNFVDETIEQTLPAVVEEFPGIMCDAYCEEGSWTLPDTTRFFERATSLGCPIRVHTDQFNSLGATQLAIELRARSVDHLEATTDQDIQRLASSETMAVALPCSGFQLDDRYAPGRRLIDAGAALALATNYNPGSAPTPSMPFSIALACRKLGLTIAEAIVCATHNAACVLGIEESIGSIAAGYRADLQLLDCFDERELGYEFATPGPQLVITAGRITSPRYVD